MLPDRNRSASAATFSDVMLPSSGKTRLPCAVTLTSRTAGVSLSWSWK